jgi:transposase
MMRDWQRALDEIADVEHRMLGVLDALELSELVTTITGLSAVGAAAILAEAGDPARFDRPRTWVKTRRTVPTRERVRDLRRHRQGLRARPPSAAHRGLAGSLGRTAPQPGLRRPLPASGHPHRQPAAPRPGPRRDRRRALLRQLFVVITRRVAWDLTIAAGASTGTAGEVVAPQAA